MTHTDLANPIWNIANLLREEFKPSEYGRVILPFTLLRRLECVLWDHPYRPRDLAKNPGFAIFLGLHPVIFDFPTLNY
jgi:hypothetical protein